MKIEELKDKRAKIVEDQRALLDKAEAEKRELTAEETQQWESMDAEFNSLSSQIKREESMRDKEKLLEQRDQTAIKPDGNGEGEEEQRNAAKMAAFRRFLAGGLAVLKPEEKRALQADDDEAGGYIVAPEQFVNELIKDIDNQTFMLTLGRTFNLTTSASLGAPSLDADPADATWTAELAVGSEDSTMDFGKRSLTPHPLAQYVKVSNKLLRVAAIGAESLVRERLGYKQAVVLENACLNGNGSGQPLGVFTASDLGISTGRDVSTGNATTSIKTDGLIEAYYTLKGGYRRNASWIFHRDGVKQIRKLKDGDGQYIWTPGITGGEPDTILGRPVYDSEYAPNTFTTGLYVGIVGDFKAYWIARALDMQIQKLVELYAATNQTGFIVRSEMDGMPVNENAFARVKLA